MLNNCAHGSPQASLYSHRSLQAGLCLRALRFVLEVLVFVAVALMHGCAICQVPFELLEEGTLIEGEVIAQNFWFGLQIDFGAEFAGCAIHATCRKCPALTPPAPRLLLCECM